MQAKNIMTKTQYWHTQNTLHPAEKIAETVGDYVLVLDRHLEEMERKLKSPPPTPPKVGTAMYGNLEGFWLARWFRETALAVTEKIPGTVGITYQHRNLPDGIILLLSQSWYSMGAPNLDEFDMEFLDDEEALVEELRCYGLQKPNAFIRGLGLVKG